MSRGLQPGIYKLRLAAGPSPLVGIDLGDPSPQPLLTRGQENLWNVIQVQPGVQEYQLSIIVGGQPHPLHIQSQGNNVVGDQDPSSVPTTWLITGPEGGPYQIQVDAALSPPIVWTGPTPGVDFSPIVLDALVQTPTPENQKWYFVLPTAT